MSIKSSPTVTVTLKRTTIEVLRAVKGNTKWDAFMLKLAGRKVQGARAKCMNCGRVLETEDIGKSAEVLAQESGWEEITVKGRPDGIGFLCTECIDGM